MEIRKIMILVFLATFFGCTANKIKDEYKLEKAKISQKSEFILNESIINIIDKSVFEVVKLKPTEDNLKYEKELPLDRIPFAIRNDKYIPYGTAFAIAENKFITAAHVLGLEDKSQNPEYYIRDKEKNVYKIDKIYKYSSAKDFVVFSVENKKVKSVLKINEKFNKNRPVFTVGNALGEGIVIRNGSLTSVTPEEENGEWNLIRFSAPASPGNSGGPLLDENGNVIGVILRKSENENLNYALPLEVVNKFEENKAIVHYRLRFQFSNYQRTKNDIYDYETNLPKKYNKLQNELIENYKKCYNGKIKEVFTEKEEEVFPNGENSLDLLNSSFDSDFPMLICQDEDNFWKAFETETETTDLKKDGWVEYGNIAGITFFGIRRPKNLKLKDLYDDSKILTDLMLKGIPISRNVAGENIKIKSFGKSDFSEDYMDNYNRKWIINKWDMKYNDSQLVTFSLPVPGGVVGMVAMSTTNIIYYYVENLKKYTDFIYLSYTGTFKDWKEYLKLKEYYPDIFKNVEITYNKESLNLKTDDVILDLKDNFFTYTDDSILQANTTYWNDEGKVKWDIGGILVSEKESFDDIFYYERVIKPQEGLSKDYFEEWENVVQGKADYNNECYFNDGTTIIGKSIPVENENVNYRYTIGLELRGKKDEIIDKKFDELSKSLKFIR